MLDTHDPQYNYIYKWNEQSGLVASGETFSYRVTHYTSLAPLALVGDTVASGQVIIAP